VPEASVTSPVIRPTADSRRSPRTVRQRPRHQYRARLYQSPAHQTHWKSPPRASPGPALPEVNDAPRWSYRSQGIPTPPAQECASPQEVSYISFLKTTGASHRHTIPPQPPPCPTQIYFFQDAVR